MTKSDILRLESALSKLQTWKNEEGQDMFLAFDVLETIHRFENPTHWYQWSDGFFTYYICKETGEKKLQLAEYDIEVVSDLDGGIKNESNI